MSALELFSPPFLIAFALTVGSILLFLLLPLFKRTVWRNGSRHAAKKKISRLGGVAMLIAFFVTTALDPHLVISQEIFGLLVGIILVCIFGLWDDISELGWKVQIFFQVALAAILYIFGMRIETLTNPFGGVWVLPTESFVLIGFVFLLLWLFLVMNALNWLDGLDGLSGSVSLITFTTIFFLSLKPEVNQPPIALLAVIGAGVTVGFLIFNIHPARILAGTTGSMFLGFLITVLAVIAGTKIATALLVLALPIADALWVIGGRLRDRRSIFQADQRHLHFKLQELGWSESHIAWFFSLVTVCIALIALHTAALGKFIALLLVLGIIFSLLLFVARKTRLKQHEKTV